jgi:hypothetical protein
MNWEPTRFGGFRRTGVTQRKSTGQTPRESVRSNPPARTWQFKWKEHLGLQSCPYLIRWRLEAPYGSIRLHHWLGPDDDRAFHDHPWDFVTFVIKGGYKDFNDNAIEHLKAPTVQHRSAFHKHTVVPDLGGCWTIVVTGPKIRHWGFWLNDKFIKANKWFLSRGHHPCS